ncbi:MAG: Lrp/AsnC ligand binding domain-containing protein [Candidatus Bathyarchaeota archaeon]
MLFKVSSGSEREVSKKIADFDEVTVVGIIFGEYDLIAKVSITSLEALEEFIDVKIRTVPNILVTSTMIIAREYKGKNNRIKK